MEQEWSMVIEFMLLSLFLCLGNVLKRKVKFFQKYLVPTAMIAGFIGLITGPEVLKIVSFDLNRLGTLVYHLMAIGFIALALKDRTHKKNNTTMNTGVYIVSTYLIQGIAGFALTLVLFYTVFPDLFPACGLLLPLGYGQGPGMAYSIGSQWEKLGFENGANVGLTIATLGFLWACLGGVTLMNFLIKRRNMKRLHADPSKAKKMIIEKDKPGDIPLSESIDRITVQIFLIGLVYLATFLTLKGLDYALVPLGTFGETLAQLLWGFHFLIGTLYAMLLRKIFNLLKKTNLMGRNYPNNYLLQRIAGGSFDFLIAASISAISITALRAYLVPILLLSLVGGFVTIIFTLYICKVMFKKHILEHILGLFGMLTGTVSTGLALLREVDPNFETDVAENLVFGSAIGLALGFPLLIILNIPIYGYMNDKPQFYIYTLLALGAYLALLLIARRFLLANKKNTSQNENN